jgi:hypothetical protein
MGLKGYPRLFSGQYYKSNRKQSSASYGIESEADAIVNVNGKMLFQKFMR